MAAKSAKGRKRSEAVAVLRDGEGEESGIWFWEAAMNEAGIAAKNSRNSKGGEAAAGKWGRFVSGTLRG